MCLGFRFLPFRPPNFETVLATQMPFAKNMGPVAAFAFGSMSMFFFDAATGFIGWWTLITAVSYGLVGVVAPYALRKMDYVSYAIVATIAYDLMTGLTMGPLLFGQPVSEALIGQIPFTAMHLLGNVIFALALSPLVERWIASNARLEFGVRKAELTVA